MTQPTPEWAKRIAQRFVDWQMTTGKFLTATESGERAPVIPMPTLTRWLAEEFDPLVEAAQGEVCSYKCPDTCCGKLRGALAKLKDGQ